MSRFKNSLLLQWLSLVGGGNSKAFVLLFFHQEKKKIQRETLVRINYWVFQRFIIYLCTPLSLASSLSLSFSFTLSSPTQHFSLKHPMRPFVVSEVMKVLGEMLEHCTALTSLAPAKGFLSTSCKQPCCQDSGAWLQRRILMPRSNT